jgi:hypothetical protein
MNSKQLNFYSHPEEIESFLHYLFLNNVNISVEPFSSEQFDLYQNADFFKTTELLFRLILFNKNEESQNIITKLVDTQNYFLFNGVESNIIQFDFPKIKENNILYRGRFYFVTGYWKGEDFIKKDPKFIKWATDLLNGFKKQFLTYKEPFTGEYCTDVVKALVQANKVTLRQL